jgi:hypothetical protein
MTESEKKLLWTLAHLSAQYMTGFDNTLNHHFQSAEEEAVAVLVQYGLVKHQAKGMPVWTEAGAAFLSAPKPN